MRTYSGHSSARASNELYRIEPGEGPDGPVGRLRPPDPDRLRPRPSVLARGEVGQGRRPGAAPRRDADPLRRDPARGHEHVDDDQRHRDVADRACTSPWPRSSGVDRTVLCRHDAERHRQGVPVPGNVHLRSRAEPPAHRRPHHPHRQARSPVEPDQRLPVPPAGSRRDAGAGAGLRAGDRGRGARRGARLGPGRPRRLPRRSSAASRSSSTPASASSRRCARCAPSRAVGPHLPRALRRDRTRSCAGSATACR